jgi:hypothetical protein
MIVKSLLKDIKKVDRVVQIVHTYCIQLNTTRLILIDIMSGSCWSIWVITAKSCTASCYLRLKIQLVSQRSCIEPAVVADSPRLQVYSGVRMFPSFTNLSIYWNWNRNSILEIYATKLEHSYHTYYIFGIIRIGLQMKCRQRDKSRSTV